ncbi:hypothetical protein H9P43_007494 [Blastocladiella emersonii ATCC 22665]|nr:hypothetical protein H9P43_007494 [Blastocladiella emersonii ATCC 22665]
MAMAMPHLGSDDATYTWFVVGCLLLALILAIVSRGESALHDVGPSRSESRRRYEDDPDDRGGEFLPHYTPAPTTPSAICFPTAATGDDCPPPPTPPESLLTIAISVETESVLHAWEPPRPPSPSPSPTGPP